MFCHSLCTTLRIRSMHTGAFRPTRIIAEEGMRVIRSAQRTYYPGGYEKSSGYFRARKPYLVPNTIAFIGMTSFVFGVYAYSIMMVCNLLCLADVPG